MLLSFDWLSLYLAPLINYMPKDNEHVEDHCESYSRLPESVRREIDQIVEDVVSRIHDVLDHFWVKKLLLPKIVNVMREFLDRINAARFGEMEVSALLTEIWKRVCRELKLHKRTAY